MQEHNHANHVHPQETFGEYLKFAFVIFGILAASIFLTLAQGWDLKEFLNSFMGVFFLIFALFKIINIETFAITYRGYDIIAKRWPAWGYTYPFIEIVLGVGYLSKAFIGWSNLVTIILMAVASVGVVQELKKKSDIPCACLGTVIRLPLSKISFVEDFLMLGMAAVMLFL